MNHRIIVDLEMAEGAILRVLGLVERRGFRICDIAMSRHEDGQRALLSLDVMPRDTSRRLEVLDLQIRRLIEVRSVVRFGSPAAAAA